MSNFTLKGIPAGIGWQNVLGIAMKRCSLMPTPLRKASPSNTSFSQKHLPHPHPDRNKIEKLLGVLTATPPDDERHRSARMSLGLLQLTSPNALSNTARNLLDEIALGVMFYEVEHSDNFTMEMGIREGNGYAALSQFLYPDAGGIYDEATELRTDTDLIQSAEEGKVEFAKRAYVSLIPYFEDAAHTAIEIRSIMSIAADKSIPKFCRNAAIEILDAFEYRHGEVLVATASDLSQELRFEVTQQPLSQLEENPLDMVEMHGFVSMWMERGSTEVLRELEAWREVFRRGNPSLAILAAAAASFLVYNLPEDERGRAILKNVVDEAFHAIEQDNVDAACEAADRLMPHIVEASGTDPALTAYTLMRLRELSQVMNAPDLLDGAYRSIMSQLNGESGSQEILDREDSELIAIADNPSQPAEMRSAAAGIMLSVPRDD